MAEVLVCTAPDRDTYIKTVWGEARGEPVEGQIAVAYVVKTRALWYPPTWWGMGVRGVCLAKKQFSCWNLDDPNYEKLKALQSDDPEYQKIAAVVDQVINGEVANPAPDATHYREVGVTADWSVGHEGIKIGRHLFFAIGPNG